MIELASMDEIYAAGRNLPMQKWERFIAEKAEEVTEVVNLCMSAGVPASNISILTGRGIHIEFKETKKCKH